MGARDFEEEARRAGRVRGLESELDILGALAAVKRHARMIFSAAGLAALVALGAVNAISPRYAGEVRVVIENRETPLTRANAERVNGQEEAQKIDSEAISSQVQIAYSRDLARAVIHDLKLTSLSEFNPLVSAGGIVPSVLGFIGLGRDIAQLTPEERALDAYYDRLNVAPVDKSRVIAIRFWAKDADLAARIANKIADRFIEFQARAKLDRDRKVRRYYDVKIEELRRHLAEAESKLEAQRASFDLLAGVNSQPLAAQSLSELNAQLSSAEIQRAEAEAKARSIRELLKSGKPIESAEIFASPLMQRLTERGAALRAEHALQSTVLLPGHPRMRELQAQLADNQTQIRAQAERISRGLENDARAAGERAGAIRQALDEKKRDAGNQGDREVQLRALEREVKAQRDLLEQWLALYRDAAARDSLEARVADARVVSQAEASNTPVFPKKLPIVILSFLGVAVCGAAFIIARALMAEPETAALQDRAMRREPSLAEGELMAEESADARRAPDASAGVVARSSGQSGEAAWRDDLARDEREMRPDDERQAAAGLAPASSAARGRLSRRLVIACGVSSARREALLAIELAMELAARGKRVVLVDGDHRSERIADEFTLDTPVGLTDLAAGRTSIAKALQALPRSHVHLLSQADHSSDVVHFDHPQIIRALQALALSYDSLVVRAASLNQVRQLLDLAGGANMIAIEAADADDPLAVAARRNLSLNSVGECLIVPHRAAAQGTRRRVA